MHLKISIATLIIAGLAAAPASFASTAGDAPFEVVQSVPLETTLAVPGVRQTQEVWLELINCSKSTLDLEQFYVSDQAGQALAPVLAAIQQAAARGVQVRLLVDSKYYSTYPDSVNQLGALANAEARTIDFSPGVQHAKFFVVDGARSFVGSQNFDWRALNQIHEIGLRVTDAQVGSDLESIFTKDWASGTTLGTQSKALPGAIALDSLFALGDGAEPALSVVASPAQVNPAGIPDTLSAVTGLIANAQQSVKIQVMEYTLTATEKGKTWTTLDKAIRAAAARGVQVELAVDVSDLKKAQAALSSLASVANVEIRSVTIPQYSGGAIPYARLIHSKYLVVDGSSGWVGSENWSEDYFTQTRDVGLVVRAQSAIDSLGAVFQQVWSSGYTTRVK
jgi:phosphatidylserine/phosphatidylglycerophosphate/cardiolipin synthase-like enzyme